MTRKNNIPATYAIVCHACGQHIGCSSREVFGTIYCNPCAITHQKPGVRAMLPAKKTR